MSAAMQVAAAAAEPRIVPLDRSQRSGHLANQGLTKEEHTAGHLARVQGQT